MNKTSSTKKKQYRIVADENMPAIEHLFGDLAEITRLDGRSINSTVLQNADALLCRSITSVDQSLLENTAVKFVGTATIGTDHLDIPWLESQKIESEKIGSGSIESEKINWANAAGCNAAAVAQYVLSAVAFWCKSYNKPMQDVTIGIVGAGNVGTELARCLGLLSIKYLLCDPPLEQSGDPRQLVPMSDIMKCDVISLHVPIEKIGNYPTYHLIGSKELKQLSKEQLLINASRGAVIDNIALINSLSSSDSVKVILDVFEDEPNVSRQLLEQCLLSTSHIAGHTLEGKLRGSWLIYQAFCENFNIKNDKEESSIYPSPNQISLRDDNLISNLTAIYDIQSDSDALRFQDDEPIAVKFDRLRKNATQLANGNIRRDYSGWQFIGDFNLPL